MKISFTKKQLEALDAIKKGFNVFLTGPGGSGKSFLIKYFVEFYKNEIETKDSQLHITSTTGLSSLLIDGMTIHRYSGIGTGLKDIDYYYKKILKMKNVKKRWLATTVLIIDEISMMNSDFFDKLENLAKKIRKIDEPFGGIQIILSGDFLQLPPVKSNDFCFESFSWDMVIKKTFYFDEIIRQDNLKLQNVLNNVRVGIINEDVKNMLNSCLDKELETSNGIKPTLLFSKKDMVIENNERELNNLIKNNYDHYTYYCSYIYDDSIDEENKIFYKEILDNQFNIENKIILSEKSQVMLTINLPEHNLANGSRGIIIGFSKKSVIPYPIVLFLNGVTLEITPHEYIIEENDFVLKKIQIPLILSWAITIHKAQGMSLEFVKTDIGNSIFEYGQAYVVLSRIKNIEGLSLININYDSIKAHPKIIKYYNKLK